MWLRFLLKAVYYLGHVTLSRLVHQNRLTFNILNILREIDLAFIFLFSVFIKSHRTLGASF